MKNAPYLLVPCHPDRIVEVLPVQTLGVLNPENYPVDDDTYPADPEIELWDSMQQNEGGVDDFLAFDIAATPEGLFRPGEEAIQGKSPFKCASILVPPDCKYFALSHTCLSAEVLIPEYPVNFRR